MVNMIIEHTVIYSLGHIVDVVDILAFIAITIIDTIY